VEISGIGLPRNGDISRGYCSQMAKFTKNSNGYKSLQELIQQKVDFENSSEYSSWVYPYIEGRENIKYRVIDEIKYGYKYFFFFFIINCFSFLRYYGHLKRKEQDENGFISIEKICSLNKIENILKGTQKEIFEILTILGNLLVY